MTLATWFAEQEEEERQPAFSREEYLSIARDLYLLEQYKSAIDVDTPKPRVSRARPIKTGG